MPKDYLELGIFEDDGTPFHLSAKDFATMHIRIYSQTGKGKTYVAGVACEEMCEAGIPFTVFDQQGHYWALKQKYPIVLYGKPGRHYTDYEFPYNKGKVEDAAKALAEAVAQTRQSVIVDMSGWTRYGQRKFVTTYLNHLFTINADYGIQRQTIIEEADIFAPLTPFDDNSQFCEDAVENIARRGRGNGLGDIIVTQRPASVSMNVRSQKDLVITLNLTEAADLAAFHSMIKDDEGFLTDGQLQQKESAIKADIAKSVRSIKSRVKRAQPGVAYIYSPTLPVRRFALIRKKKTYHAGAAVGSKDYVDPRKVQVIPCTGDVARFGFVENLLKADSRADGEEDEGGSKKEQVQQAKPDMKKYIAREAYDRVLRECEMAEADAKKYGAQVRELEKKVAELEKEKLSFEDQMKTYKRTSELVDELIGLHIDAAEPYVENFKLKVNEKIATVDVQETYAEADFAPDSLEHRLCVLVARGYFAQPKTATDIHAEIYNTWGGMSERQKPGGKDASTWRYRQLGPALGRLCVMPYYFLRYDHDEAAGTWVARPESMGRIKLEEAVAR